jgi:ATP-binding cassette subfamily F protein 2
MADKKDKKPRRVGKRAAAKQKEAEGAPAVQEIVEKTDKIAIDNNRSSTGVLTSEKNSRDVKVNPFDVD